MKKLIETIKYQRITEWNEEEIILENGMVLSLEETDSDCCASASGEWIDVKLDAIITDIQIKIDSYQEETYGTEESKATVTIFNNRNEVCAIGKAEADSGNGAYYYSVCSLVVRLNNEELFEEKVMDC